MNLVAVLSKVKVGLISMGWRFLKSLTHVNQKARRKSLRQSVKRQRIAVEIRVNNARDVLIVGKEEEQFGSKLLIFVKNFRNSTVTGRDRIEIKRDKEDPSLGRANRNIRRAKALRRKEKLKVRRRRSRRLGTGRGTNKIGDPTPIAIE